ncbi:leucine-rich repeat extensin-like protein 3 [Schistocerca americana]|uniref:leucine-rich repeat extensin-like protein 3 n=1 Tax=Schistocerca americana TaxID=7009 RepID=UPI001F4F6BDE|nr:leucine-rich repeat extensin-like protein 3 [Schistocerca americana]
MEEAHVWTRRRLQRETRPFLEYGPPPDSRTAPPPPPPPPLEKRLKYVSVAKPVVKWSTTHVARLPPPPVPAAPPGPEARPPPPQKLHVLYAPAPIANAPPPPPPPPSPPTLPPPKYQTAKPLPPVTPPPSPPSPPPPPPPPQKPKPPVRPHLVYGPPPEFQTEKPSLPSPPPPPPPQLPVRPYDSAEQTAIPEPPHRFSLPASDHHKKRHFVKRDTDNAITSFLYRFVDDGSAFDERGQLKLNAHDKTLGSYAYRYVGTDGVTVDVSRTPAA